MQKENSITNNSGVKIGTSPFKRDEIVDIVVYNNQLICIGLDGAGQSYFIVYKDNDEGCIKTECLNAYYTDINDYIEWKFGNPVLCEHYYEYGNECTHKNKGYCDRCKRFDNKEYLYNKLVDLGVMDKYGNIKEEYLSILQVKE